MKFILPQSLFQGACSQIVSKKEKEKKDQVILPKTRFSLVGTNSPLGLKFWISFMYYPNKKFDGNSLESSMKFII